MLKIYTANIHKISRSNPNRLDITVKTGEKAFAPSWEMLLKIKGGEMSKDEYKKRYVELMRESKRKYPEKWKDLISRDIVIFVCYCPANCFCHRVLLAKMLEISGMAIYAGEIYE